jgi:hypothetical protein
MIGQFVAMHASTSNNRKRLTVGPNAGKRVIYVRDPDGTTIEFMQPPED